MRLTGPLLAVFIIYHILHFTTGTVLPGFKEGDVHANLVRGLSFARSRCFTCWRCCRWASTCGTASGVCSRRSGVSQPKWLNFGRKLATALTILRRWWLRRHSSGRLGRGHQITRMPCRGTEIELPRRPHRAEVGQAQVRHEAGQPGQQAQVRRHRRRHRPGRRAAAAASLAELGYNVTASASRTARAAPTPSPRRAASTPPRTTRTTATASSGSSTTRSRAATSAPARPTSTASPRSRRTSSTSAWPRACPSPANTAGCWPTAPSAAPRCRAPSTPAARRASSSCWAPTQALCSARSAWAR